MVSGKARQSRRFFHFARKLFLPRTDTLSCLHGGMRLCAIWHGLRCLLHRRLSRSAGRTVHQGIYAAGGTFPPQARVMFLLRLGELLEEWTRPPSLSDLAPIT